MSLVMEFLKIGKEPSHEDFENSKLDDRDYGVFGFC